MSPVQSVSDLPDITEGSIAATKKGIFVSCRMFVVSRTDTRKGNAMNDFISRFQDQLQGTLSGFDRLVFMGTVWRNRLTGMKGYLWAKHLGCKDFAEHAED